MPLVLERKAQESIVIDGDIVVTAHKCRSGKVSLAIEAPREINVMRSELITPCEPTETQLVRSKMIGIARNWARHTAGGLDILASACLDEMQSLIAEVRP